MSESSALKVAAIALCASVVLLAATIANDVSYGGTNGAATGHVPQQNNTNGGVNSSSFNRANRLLDNDAYYVQVTG